jgi:hypothetical protein
MKAIKTYYCCVLSVFFFLSMFFAFVWHGESFAIDATDSMKWFHSSLRHSFGHSIFYAGDFNGDGRDDFIVGAPGTNDDDCRAYIFYGPDPAIPPTGRSISVDDANVVFEGPSSVHIYGSRFGHAVAGGGDFNGDGIGDVIVGAPNASAHGQNFEGCAYIFFGQAHLTNDQLVIPASSADVTLCGNDVDDQFGWSVAFAGHMNDDELDDVIVGAPEMNHLGGVGGGGYFLGFFGFNTGGAQVINPPHDFGGDSGGGNLGYAVAGIGDFNADGYDDFMVSAPLYSRSNENEDRTIGLVMIWERRDFLFGPCAYIYGSQHFGQFGSSIAAAGDVNHDGYADIIVGAPSMASADGDENVGFAYVILGRRTGEPGSSLRLEMWHPYNPAYLPPGVIQIQGEQAYDYFGESVSTVGDFNEVGIDDFIVGASRKWEPSPSGREGRAYIFAGRAMDRDAFTHFLAGEEGLTFVGEGPSHFFGWSVAGGFHWTQGGFFDALIGASGNKSVYLFNRRLAPFNPQPHRGFPISLKNNTDRLPKNSPFYLKSLDPGTVFFYFIEPGKGNEQTLQLWGESVFAASVPPGKSVTLSVPWPVCSSSLSNMLLACKQPSKQASLFWALKTTLDSQHLAYAVPYSTTEVQYSQGPPIFPLAPSGVDEHSLRLCAVENSYSQVGGVKVFYSPPLVSAVKINPQVINLKFKGGLIKCTISFPEGYAENNVDPKSVSIAYPACKDCPPANSVRGFATKNTYIAFFKRIDLINLVRMSQHADGQMMLRVSGHLKHGNFFEGDAAIRLYAKR